MSNLSSKDIETWLKNTELPRLGTEYRRTATQQELIERTVLKTEQTRQWANMMEIRTNGAKIFPGWTTPRIFADGTRPKIFVAGGIRPRGFADGTKPWIFTDGTGTRSFTDGTRPKIFTDGTRPRIFTDNTELKDVATGYTVVAGTEPKTTGEQQNVDGNIENIEECLRMLPVGNEKFRQRSLATIGQGQSNAEFYGRVKDRSEYMRQRSGRQTIQKFNPNNLHVPNLMSYATKSETDGKYLPIHFPGGH